MPIQEIKYLVILLPYLTLKMRYQELISTSMIWDNPEEDTLALMIWIINENFLSGLIAAKEFGDLFPALREAIFVASSVYYASRQVRFDKYIKLHCTNIVSLPLHYNLNYLCYVDEVCNIHLQSLDCTASTIPLQRLHILMSKAKRAWAKDIAYAGKSHD